MKVMWVRYGLATSIRHRRRGLHLWWSQVWTQTKEMFRRILRNDLVGFYSKQTILWWELPTDTYYFLLSKLLKGYYILTNLPKNVSAHIACHSFSTPLTRYWSQPGWHAHPQRPPKDNAQTRGGGGHRPGRPRDQPLPVPLPRAHGVGRADEAAENGAVLLAARRGGHGQGAGGVQAMQGHGARGVWERHGGRHLPGAEPQLQVGGGGADRRRCVNIVRLCSHPGKVALMKY